MGRRTKHTHKYMKQQLSQFNRGWRCVIPKCDHFLPRNVEDTIAGRMSLCWECGNEFQLDEDSIQEDQPRCAECRLSPDERAEIDMLGDMDIRAKIAKTRGVSLSEVTQEEIDRVKKWSGLL